MIFVGETKWYFLYTKCFASAHLNKRIGKIDLRPLAHPNQFEKNGKIRIENKCESIYDVIGSDTKLFRSFIFEQFLRKLKFQRIIKLDVN